MIKSESIAIYHIPTSVAIVPILKNGSATIRLAAANSEWNHRQYYVQSGASRYCVILRDPVERFKSALNYLMTSTTVPQPISNLIQFKKDVDFDMVGDDLMDQHFRPQCSYLIDLFEVPGAQIDYFHLKPGLLQDLNDFYGFNLAIIETTNVTKHKVITEVNEDIIKSAYRADYDLIQRVNFVNCD